MQVEYRFFVGVQDVGIGSEMTNKAILEALTNVTNIHGNQAGQSTRDLAASHLAWVVLNWKLQVLERAKVCETILVRTWAQTYTRVMADRDYEIFNQSGRLMARATSRWTAVNTNTGSFVRLSPEVMNVYGCEPEHQNFPDYQFQKIIRDKRPALSSMEFKVNKAMIDCNNHVHNPAYLDFAAEVLPEGLDIVQFDNLEVSYRREVTPGETVLLEYVKEGDKHMVFVSDRPDGSLHAVVTLY
jgi:acyl-ACP thioesterase